MCGRGFGGTELHNRLLASSSRIDKDVGEFIPRNPKLKIMWMERYVAL